MTVKETYDHMMSLAAELADLESAAALLGWDQETNMPEKGIEGRAHVSATMAGVRHEKLTHGELHDLLLELKEVGGDMGPENKAQVAALWRTHDRASRVPGELVKRMAKTRSEATAVWGQARKNKDFDGFAPKLSEMMSLQKEYADALGHDGTAYNALLEEYEPGAKLADIERVLNEVKDFLIPFVKAIADSGVEPDLKCVLGPYDTKKQGEFGAMVIKAMGFDLGGGRVDVSNHPFCSGIHGGDVRLTTRYKDDLRVGLLGTIHEAGHGLYEQGALAAHARTPLADIQSLGIHESQSRMWENNVGLSHGFWNHFFPKLQDMFPEHLASTDVNGFYAAMNDVRPSLIRIEADEVTYNLHIVLRFEIERDLLAGNIEVKDLPEVWNEKFRTYFGIVPPTPDVGVLQDIHWAAGYLGYFPTYTLGSLNAAQFYAAAGRALPDLEEQIARGDFIPLRDWLVENVHRWGSSFAPNELMERATGKPTNAADLITYFKTKYGELYGLS